MVMGYISVYFISILFWHHCIKKVLPIKLVFVGKDIAPYLVISVLVFGSVNYTLKNISDIYILLSTKILLSSILYVLILFLLKSTILKEITLYLRDKML